ncbi:hypothetical protein CDAR_10491 [Caerostris darwini]|uniref:Uncharacterized protein n=1 Tax=Caerostris darwini TaxID=1538125 RepID=A0AAV4UYL2_9ARAC|nr:hypothetical protein CDAR_10491 [Caerostris darwini]
MQMNSHFPVDNNNLKPRLHAPSSPQGRRALQLIYWRASRGRLKTRLGSLNPLCASRKSQLSSQIRDQYPHPLSPGRVGCRAGAADFWASDRMMHGGWFSVLSMQRGLFGKR